MNVLIVSQFFYPERFILNDLALELSARGHKLVVLTGQPNYPDGVIYTGYSNFSRWSDQLENIEIIRVPVLPRKKGTALNLVLNYLSFILSSLIFGAPRIITKKIDVIFAWGTSPILQALPALFIKFIKRKKVILWVQDLWPETLSAIGMIKSPFLIKLIGFFVSFIYRFTDLILIQSEGFRPSVLKYSGQKNKIHWAPNWSSSPQSFQGCTEGFPQFHPDKFNVLFAGNLGKAQSLETIINAAESLRGDEQIHFVFLGEGSEKKRIQDIALAKKLTNITFLPGRPADEMPYYFNLAQALLVTLINDSTIERVIPSKIQSYMSSGKPIVAAVNGEAHRALTEAKCAAVGPAENAVTLAENIKHLYQMTDKEIKIMGTNGIKYYQENFEKNLVITKIESLLQRGCR